MTVTRVPRLFLLILAELYLTAGGTVESIYGLIGKELQLNPKVTGALSSITWKKEKDKVAEWDRSLGHDYYGRCSTENQCELNNSTGVLVMKGLKREDEGLYSAEINNKGPAKESQLIVLERVSKPSVTPSCNETHCILTCVGEETKHTKYSWKENDVTVKEGNTLMVEKSREQSKSYTCVFSNPKSEEHSDPLTQMDLFPGPPVGPIIGGVFGGVLFIVLVAVAVYCGLGRRGGQNKQDTDGQENTPLQVVNATDTQNTQNAGGQAVQEGTPLLNHNSEAATAPDTSGPSNKGVESAAAIDSQANAEVHNTQMENGLKGGETEDNADNPGQESIPQDPSPQQEMNQEFSEKGGGEATQL